jgi:phosphonate transport system permease protein
MDFKAATSGKRRWVILAFVGIFLWCAWYLGLKPSGLIPPDETHWERTGRFFAAAFQPALDYTDPNTPDDAPPIWWKALEGLFLTLKFAFGAMSLAVPAALALGFFGSSSWWPSPCPRLLKGVLSAIYFGTRFLMSLVRSIHELIWALLILSAMGVSPLAGMVALALPFSGTLGKVFSELIDEEARDAAQSLKAIGHRPLQTFLVGIFPAALPNLITYSFYRFECALRSSAVLGFVGIETIGLYIRLSHEEAYYREVWTYLYPLLAMIILVDLWGAGIRRRVNGTKGGCVA